MITDADVKKLKAVFATKDDLIGMEKRQETKFATKDDLKSGIVSLKKDIKKIQKTLDTSIKLTELQLKDHHNRLENLEEKTGFKRPPFPAN